MTLEELVALYESPDSVPPNPGLQGLSKIDWAGVSDAYGPATNVPALIRALVSTEPIHRDYAVQALCQHIYHQGTVYSATAKLVPILHDLLISDETPDKTLFAFLLALVADGTAPFQRCENDPQDAARWREILRKQNRSLDEEIAEGIRFMSELRANLVEVFSDLYPFLRDPNPEIRHAIVIAIGNFPNIARRVRPDLKAALEQEEDKYVRDMLQDVIERAK